MKSSYTTTPRTMRDCTWSSWGDPIERPESAARGLQDAALYIVACIALAVVVAVL